jgi:hypothetical protein
LDKKGFLFTVTIFLILTYILLSISVWVKAVETSELAYSEFYKESTVQLSLEQITPAKIDNMTNVIMERALFRLNNNVIVNNPVAPGPQGNLYQNINDSLYNLLTNNTAPNSDFQNDVGITDDGSGSSLNAWVSNLNNSLLAIGVYVSYFNVSGFNAYQGSMNTVNYSFNLSLDLSDYTNTSSVSRTYLINSSVDITGLVDPALANASKDTIYRQFFFNTANYSSPANITVPILSSGLAPEAGQGWLYGYLASASPSNADPLIPNATDVNFTQMQNYILVGSFQEITSFPYYRAFGGYIVTDSPSYSGTCSNEGNTFNPITHLGSSCSQPALNPAPSAGALTALPFIVVPGFNPSTAPECPIFTNNTVGPNDNGTMGRCALITNKYSASQVNAAPTDELDTSNSSIYGVESIRDFVMCGYYTQDPAAPSYFERLLPDPYSLNDATYGIETFVIGEYANATYDTDSRLDREMFNATVVPGIKIMGLPGCKDYETCADTPSTGIFAASDAVITAYGLENISCNATGTSRCG